MQRQYILAGMRGDVALPGKEGCAWCTVASLCGLHAGAITPLGRRREIYSICREYNILILEDDPYYYLQFSTAHGGEPKGLADLGSSYLSMDTDSRVIRLDSFSKARPRVFSPPALPALSAHCHDWLICLSRRRAKVCFPADCSA